MLLLYKTLTFLSSPLLVLLLHWRVFKRKEDKLRLYERQGKASLTRPRGRLVWIHAASVGEAQSALILIQKLSKTNNDLNFLVTSGTKTSAALMAKRLPDHAIHQYYPLDHPTWVRGFLSHWKPNLVLWMESEIWPNMLLTLKEQKIPAFLINARLSSNSFKRWSYFKKTAERILSTFAVILAQTKTDKERFNKLGSDNVNVTDNLKYSAATLPYEDTELKSLQTVIGNRPLWLYASTHDGEEIMAARIHEELKDIYPDVLTIIVPRHPERREEINKQIKVLGLKATLRSENHKKPDKNTDIYIADTLGELGLFYALSEIAVIGRSFSHDGGGGHNPIEAAQLACAVITGPHIQYQTQLFSDMFNANAAIQVFSEQELFECIKLYLSDNQAKDMAIKNAHKFAKEKENIIFKVLDYIEPYIQNMDKKRNEF